MSGRSYVQFLVGRLFTLLRRVRVPIVVGHYFTARHKSNGRLSKS